MIIIAIIFLLFYIAAPIRTKIVLAFINIFFPDPIPYLDEFIMWGNLLMNLAKVGRIIEFIEEHRHLSIFCGIIIVIMMLVFIF